MKDLYKNGLIGVNNCKIVVDYWFVNEDTIEYQKEGVKYQTHYKSIIQPGSIMRMLNFKEAVEYIIKKSETKQLEAIKKIIKEQEVSSNYLDTLI